MSNFKLNSKNFKDKVAACWIGKNIGGTMGGPYECTHDILDVKGFTTAPGIPLPNDDLDLQLVWLHTVEQLGPRAINTVTLGEAWLSFIVPHWNEYGIGKKNMVRGLIPPLSGDYDNLWKHSNGAWIRTEVWACLAPAAPAVAAKYAIEDAKVDHGSGEGTYAAAFVAAMQSAAFVIKDLRKCIEIGLSQIPEDSRMADSIRLAIDCYDKKVPAMDARNIIQQRNADIGNGWFEAPSNVAYAIIGLLYGEGDFKKSMITAINCGDDTDCTAATVGATMGILGGMAIIPTDWKEHIGDDIITVSINKGSVGRSVPQTCTELTDRVVAQTPAMLITNKAQVELHEGEDEIPENVLDLLVKECNAAKENLAFKPYSMHFDFTFLSVDVSLDSSPDITPCCEKKVTVKVTNNIPEYDCGVYNLNLRWWLPEGFTVEGRKTVSLHQRSTYYNAMAETTVTIKVPENFDAENKCVLEISAVGRMTPMYIPILLLG